MKASDTVKEQCICCSDDFLPFASDKKVNHCYGCDAYNDGKRYQAELSFKAGIKEVVEYFQQRHNRTVWETYNIVAIPQAEWQAKLKEWGMI